MNGSETLLDTVLSTAQEEGLVVDMALGPNQGAGVPAPFDSDGLLWDLNFFDVSVLLEEVFLVCFLAGTLALW
jgi:hypothetical protein